MLWAVRNFLGTWTLAEVLIAIVVICAAVMITVLVLRHLGITIPPVIVTIIWIVVVAIIAVFAIRLLLEA